MARAVRAKNAGLFVIDVEGLTETLNSIDRFSNRANNVQPMFAEGRQNWLHHIEGIFDAEGPGWKALSPMRTYRRNGQDHPILDYTGQLKAAASGRPMSGEDIQGDYKETNHSLSMTISGAKVAHNTAPGFWNDENHWTPQREFWPWGDPEQDVFFSPFEKWVDSWIGEAR
jgi:hypothetical protein